MAADGQELVDGIPAEEVVALLSVPQTDFVAARNARAKELRSTGAADLAAVVAKLRKPPRMVWVVGEIARRDPALADRAVAAAEHAEAATSGGSDIRKVLEDFRGLVGQASAAGAAIDRVTDRPAVELALREVLSDPTARRAWAGGWLLHMPGETAVPGDELSVRRARRAAERAAAAVPSAGAHRPGGRPTPSGDPAPGEGPGPRAAGQPRRSRAAASAAERRAREKARERARRQHSQAEMARAEARRRNEAARSAVEELEERSAALEADLDAARQLLVAADAELAVTDQRVAAAQATLDQLDRE